MLLLRILVQIRAIPFGNDDRLWLEPIDIELINPNGDQIRKWSGKNAASTGGPITIQFPLDKPNICGKWTGWNNLFYLYVYNRILKPCRNSFKHYLKKIDH